MAYQAIFERYEMKYMITLEQKARLLTAMEPYMALDQYGRSTIRNIYYDTDDYRLIRRSIEKPVYKEKLRIRSYCQATPESTVFIELKKKFKKVVYKRRLTMPEAQAMKWMSAAENRGPDSQISREIDYFREHYGTLRPAVFLTYEREAYYCKQGGDFRVTFDENILCRLEDISLTSQAWGTPLIPEGFALMELKCSGGVPLWMTHVLSEEHIYITSFSKYGTAYQTMILPNMIKGRYSYA